jgi:serine protease
MIARAILLGLAGCLVACGGEGGLEPARLFASAGGQAQLRLQLSPPAGFTQSVHLALEGGPPGMGLEPREVLPRHPLSLELRLQVPDQAAPAEYPMTLRVWWGRGAVRQAFWLKVVAACTGPPRTGASYLVRVGPAAPASLAQGRLRLERPLALPGFALYRLEEGPVPAGIWPNRRMRLFRVPNDPLYPHQWHLQTIRMEAAWAVQTGLEHTIRVGAVDSGVASGHPDLPPIGGYDFVSDPSAAGDCDGRDPDPSEPSERGFATGFHGTHVLGTILARSNNGLGIAGINWGAQGLMARAFGGIEGEEADALEAMLWLAGLPVPGVPPNPQPVQVINLSFGSPGGCPEGSLWRLATRQVLERGVVLVAAAGNQAQPAENYEPASCPGVIAVGATDARGYRSGYSNHGPRVDLYAQGESLARDDNQDGSPDGILSLGVGPGGGFTYTYAQGTSFAAPHVSGAVSLLLAQNPQLSPAAVLERLRRTARELPQEHCQPLRCPMRLLDAGALLGPG